MLYKSGAHHVLSDILREIFKKKNFFFFLNKPIKTEESAVYKWTVFVISIHYTQKNNFLKIISLNDKGKARKMFNL